MVAVVLLAVGAAGAVLALVALTTVGARRRGRSVPAAVVAGLFFPVTWAAWYVVDRDPPPAG